MSSAALERLESAAHDLRAAMESGDADRMNGAIHTLSGAVAQVQGKGGWHSDPQTKSRLRSLLARLDSDQMLARLLGDLTGRQLGLLAERSSLTAPATYARPR